MRECRIENGIKVRSKLIKKRSELIGYREIKK